jgi:hypothetical protein
MFSNNNARWVVQPDRWDSDNEAEEVWESINGDLWLIVDSDYANDGAIAFGYARLYSMPQFAEWGSIDRKQLQEEPTIWQVDKMNWGNINSYEDGLLVQVDSEEDH